MGNSLRMTSVEYQALVEKRKNRAGEPPAPKKRASKYGNVKTDGADSKKEAHRRQELALLLVAGKIRHLRHQVKYAFVHNGQLIATYIADHVYYDIECGCEVTEDTKSPATRRDKVYALKKTMMRVFHGIEIKET